MRQLERRALSHSTPVPAPDPLQILGCLQPAIREMGARVSLAHGAVPAPVHGRQPVDGCLLAVLAALRLLHHNGLLPQARDLQQRPLLRPHAHEEVGPRLREPDEGAAQRVLQEDARQLEMRPADAAASSARERAAVLPGQALQLLEGRPLAVLLRLLLLGAQDALPLPAVLYLQLLRAGACNSARRQLARQAADDGAGAPGGAWGQQGTGRGG
mmetsp:Transcript_43077/g.136965  ORF Transcript_43077/g.136965 Transcript_43077/m.136965 type:complete len:214 (-) Transcript_43077:261-902(-)